MYSQKREPSHTRPAGGVGDEALPPLLERGLRGVELPLPRLRRRLPPATGGQHPHTGPEVSGRPTMQQFHGSRTEY